MVRDTRSLVAVLAVPVSFVVACGAPAPTPSAVGESRSSIVSGSPVSASQINGAVALLDPTDDSESCSGVLIAPRVILTAAHCVLDDNRAPLAPDAVAVAAGILDISQADSSQFITPQKLTFNPAYLNIPAAMVDSTPLGQEDDVGLVILGEPITNVTPVPILPKDQVATALAKGQMVTLSGYGARGNSNHAADGVLYTAQTPVEGVSQYEVQAGAPGNPDSCDGDSGGPLYANVNGVTYLAATTSRGSTAAGKCGSGGIYELSPAYVDWIVANTGGLYAPITPVAAGGSGADGTPAASGHDGSDPSDPGGSGAASPSGGSNRGTSGSAASAAGTTAPAQSSGDAYPNQKAASSSAGGCTMGSRSSGSPTFASLMVIGLVLLGRRRTPA